LLFNGVVFDQNKDDVIIFFVMVDIMNRRSAIKNENID
jgi:hypothetical protein